jgi:DNA-binding NtrC family response regulator
MRSVPAAREGSLRPESARGVVLLVDDEPLLLKALERILRPEGHEVRLASDLEEARPHLEDPALDVVLVDLFLSGASGLEVLDRAVQESLQVEVIVMTGHASIESAVGCMRRGAFDYLAKPFDDAHRVRATVGKAIERRHLLRRNRELEDELRGRGGAAELVGRSAAMRALQRKVESLRHNQSNVLIQGESGTGKELVARAIHAASPRRQGPFVPVDCGALPETIIESELFGHERGAFTGAVGAPGLFRLAQSGTLLLDEVGEIPLHVQAKLLRALQQREVRPVGGSEAVPVDIRVIAATNRDLPAMVEGGRFRLDLYYRLNVVRIEVAPLRERLEDVPLLAAHFLAKHARGPEAALGLEPDALEKILHYAWPGNVRELENAIEAALALGRGPRLRAGDFAFGAAGRSEPPPPAHALPLTLDAYERCALERALRESGGDATQAARSLGIGRSTLYRKLARHGLRADCARRSASP